MEEDVDDPAEEGGRGLGTCINSRHGVLPGISIEKERYPSPPSPSPAMLGPFFTNRVVSIRLPIFVMLRTLFEWIMAVCRKPCSLRWAISMA